LTDIARPGPPDAERGSRARFVVLGASNVALGFRAAVSAARERLGGPLDVFAAFGHGRSYGVEGRVLGRTLPAITACGLWRALAADGPRATFALVTDVGNDVAFGFPPSTIETWVAACVERLRALGAEIVLTGVPLDALRRVPPIEFWCLSRLFFPGRGIVRERALAQALELDGRLRELARRAGLAFVAPCAEWYGRDPIHVRRRARAQCWRAYCAPWPIESPSGGARADSPWRQRGRLVAEERRLFGFAAGAPQPSATLADGSRLHAF
jgi:hypothetical protein